MRFAVNIQEMSSYMNSIEIGIDGFRISLVGSTSNLLINGSSLTFIHRLRTGNGMVKKIRLVRNSRF